MTFILRPVGLWMAVAGASLLLQACGTTPRGTLAPVEDRPVKVLEPLLDANKVPLKQPPGFENAGKPGYYTVKPGETLIRIGLETGQNWRDLARWNSLDQPDQIEVGQVLRVVPPLGEPDATPNGDGPGVVTRPIAVASIPAAPVKPGQASAPVRTAASAPASTAAVHTAVAGTDAAESGLSWIWPAPGPVLAGFDEVKNKGLDLGGKAGDPVLAAAAGKVVYAGAGLRGYGNLIILKHNNAYLTAYAHNKALLVKEDQTVRKGQKIAEMGSSDADRVKLHFEVRRKGKPVDPIRYLPPR